MLLASTYPAQFPRLATLNSKLASLANGNVKSLRWRHVTALVLFIFITGNLSFYHQVTAIYPTNLSYLSFLLSLGVLVTALTLLLYSTLSLLLGSRLAVTLLLMLTSCSAFFTDNFGIVIDYTMVDNFLQTDRNELKGLMSSSFIFSTMIFGIIPAMMVYRLPPLKISRAHEMRRTGFLLGTSILLIGICLVSYSENYASFFRDHKSIRYYVNPVNPVFAISKYAVKKLEHSAPTYPEPILVNAKPAVSYSPKLVVMVVGETARSDRLSINGYARETTPLLASEPGITSYADVQSCGTSTAVSVPCMFSAVGRSDFNAHSIRETENILDVLQRIGINILWRDNNSDSKGVALRVPYEDFRSSDKNPVCDTECRDVGMLDGLQSYIDQQSGDILIVLHQMGNHGPAYASRYPAAFEYFTPACQSKELSNCTKAEIDNAYDNAIRYTDYFLAQVISLLKDNSENFDTTMLYVSDHGESLGELGVYLHGMPYLISPPEQRKVPVITWEEEDKSTKLPNENIMAQSHDAVFKSLLTTFGIQAVTEVKGPSFLVSRSDISESNLTYKN